MIVTDSFFSEGFKLPPDPFWISSTPKTEYPMLEDNLNIDIAIVGGGMTGITSAYLLKKEGLKVAVIDAGRIIQGTSGHTTAKITSQHGLIYNKLLGNFGRELTQQYATSNEAAIAFIQKLVQQENIECDFSDQSAYTYTQDDNYIKKIEEEAHLAATLGINAQYTESIPLPINTKAAVCFQGQAQFHPRKYLYTLQKNIPGDGCYIFENTRIMDIKEGNPCTLITEHGNTIKADKIIIASHYPCYDGKGLYFTRLYPERSYALGVKVAEDFPGGMYITAEDPTRSLRYTPYNNEKLLIVGGEHHKTGQGENMNSHYIKLRDFTSSIFTIEDIPFRWSTHDYMTPDESPYIGNLTSSTPNIYVATGYKKWGMTTSTVAAIMLRDFITKGESPWKDIYNPSRKNLNTTFETIIKENIDVAKHYFKGKLSELENNVLIKNGEAKVVDVNGTRAGAYRDENGELHIVDTSCPHVGCELNWNNAEKTWDCPCHGSRFTIDGDIVEGPAIHRLKNPMEDKNETDPNIF